MILITVIVSIVLGLAVGAGLVWVLTTRFAQQADEHRRMVVDAAVARALEERQATAATLHVDRDATVQAAVARAAEVADAKLDARLRQGAEALDARSAAFEHQVGQLTEGLTRIGELVATLQKDKAAQHGQFMSGLAEVTRRHSELHQTTQALHQALASPKARGQWGERMADDVLRTAGFVEGVNYRKQAGTADGRIPDFTFLLPGGLELNMDVKFPIDNYLRSLEAGSDHDRQRATTAFARDVRNRIGEIAGRGYIDPDRTVGTVLLFIPNEAVYAFLHENDPEIVDRALGQKVVLCSPFTLFSVLAVIRQAVENFHLERTGDQILECLNRFTAQWTKFTDHLDKVDRQLGTFQKSFDELKGTRRTQLERQLDRVAALRVDRVDEPGPADEPDSADHGRARLGALREIRAS